MTTGVDIAYNLRMNNLLGQRVLLARRDLDINQDELARRVGVSRPFVSDIERGKTTNVGVETVFALAEALGVRAAYLMGLSDVVVDEDAIGEEGGLYVTMDAEERRLLEDVVGLFRGLGRDDQRLALSFLRRMAGEGRVIGDG